MYCKPAGHGSLLVSTITEHCKTVLVELFELADIMLACVQMRKECNSECKACSSIIVVNAAVQHADR